MFGATSRERRLALATAIALGLLVLDKVWLAPLLQHWGRVSEETQKAAAELEKARNLLDNADAIRARWKQASEEIAAAELAMSFQAYLSSLEQRAGVTEKNRKSLPKSAASKHTVESFDVSLSGSLAGLVAFLRELDASPRLLRVSRLSVRGRENDANLDADLTVSTLLANEPAAKAKE
jgi:hypothetical protein